MQEQLNNLERGVGRIEGKLDGVLARLEAINEVLATHDTRINKLEQENAKNSGIAAGISFVVSVAVAMLNFIFKNK